MGKGELGKTISSKVHETFKNFWNCDCIHVWVIAYPDETRFWETLKGYFLLRFPPKSFEMAWYSIIGSFSFELTPCQMQISQGKLVWNHYQSWSVIPVQRQESDWSVWETARGRSPWSGVPEEEQVRQEVSKVATARSGRAGGSWETLWQFCTEWGGGVTGVLWADK